MSTSNRKSSFSGSQRRASGSARRTSSTRTSRVSQRPSVSTTSRSSRQSSVSTARSTRRSPVSGAPRSRSTVRSPRTQRSGQAQRARQSQRPGSSSRVSDAQRRSGGAAMAFKVAVGVGIVAFISVIALVVLSNIPVFTIEGITAEGSQHVSAETIAKLASVNEGTTLLNVDVAALQANVQKNPWIKSVHITREFPNRLGISVEERSVYALAVIGSGDSVWALGDDGVWIEPVQVSASQTTDVTDAARTKAQEQNCLLISQLPSTVSPQQASSATDAVIKAVFTCQNEFSPELAAEVQTYNAPSESSISLILKNGLEVSLGSASDIAAKQAALTEIRNTYPTQLTYVNVRIPSKPTYRKTSTDTLAPSTSPATTAATPAATSATAPSSSAATPSSKNASAKTSSRSSR